MPLQAFLEALKLMNVEDVDIDEVACIVANLIYQVDFSTFLHLLVSICAKYIYDVLYLGQNQGVHLPSAPETCHQ